MHDGDPVLTQPLAPGKEGQQTWQRSPSARNLPWCWGSTLWVLSSISKSREPVGGACTRAHACSTSNAAGGKEGQKMQRTSALRWEQQQGSTGMGVKGPL